MRLLKYNNPQTTKQDYGTHTNLMSAVEKRFGKITHDLAAHSDNLKSSSYFSLEEGIDSMLIPWPRAGLNWLNPPYSKRPESPYSLTAWSEKCKLESLKDVQILFLVPAAVGSKWFLNNVFGCSDIYFLNGRIIFDGTESGITIDIMLAHYHPSPSYKIRVWDWRSDLLFNHSPE